MNASEQTADEVAERLFGALLGTVEIMSVYLGDRLGWYRALAMDGPASPAELARRTDTQVRYAREWLEQQAVSGLLVVESDGAPDDRRFAIPSSTAEVMTDATSLAYLAPMGRMFGAVGPVLPRLLEVYRSGGGVRSTSVQPVNRFSRFQSDSPWRSRTTRYTGRLRATADPRSPRSDPRAGTRSPTRCRTTPRP